MIGVGIGIAFLFTVNARTDDFSKFQRVDFNVAYDLFYLKDIEKYATKNEWSKCVEVMGDFVKREPEMLNELNAYHKVKNADEYNLAMFFARIHAMYASILKNNGNQTESAIHLTRSEALNKAIENVKIN